MTTRPSRSQSRLALVPPDLDPLPRRVQPQPWEDLHSFLTRTAKGMQYEKASWVIQPQSSPYHIPSSEISLLTEQADYLFLSQLLCLPEETLYHMTLHRFSPFFQPLDLFPVTKTHFGQKSLLLQATSIPSHSPIARQLLPKGFLRPFFLPNQTTQCCPLCLQQPLPYDRLFWKLRYVLTCHHHALLLQCCCQICHKRPPSSRDFFTSCPFCHTPYPTTPLPPEVADTLLHGDLLTLHALGVSLLPNRSPLSSDPRARLSPAHYFALLRALSISLRPLHTPDFQSFLPPALYALLAHHTPGHDFLPPLHVAAIHWIFTDWPNHFFPFLDALELRCRRPYKQHAFRFFPQRFPLGAGASEALSLLQDAYQFYQATFLPQGESALQRRVQQRLNSLSP